MNKKIIVLTDHFTHGKGESIYPLLKTMVKNEFCDHIDIASRGNSGNKPFFSKYYSTELFVKRVTDDFAFQEQGKPFVCDTQKKDIQDYDIVFLRMDRPVNTDFTDFLMSKFPKEKIINNPIGIHKTGTKEFLLNFPELCPSMKLCRSLEDVESFMANHPIVLKPLESYGGQGLIKIEDEVVLFERKAYPYKEYKDILKEQITDGYLAVEFLRNVTKGDKRIIVVNGKVMGATLRMPPDDSYICNLSQGGSSEFAEVDDDELFIASIISPPIVESGVAIFGFDTLVNDDGKRVLSEINTLNVGGLLQAEIHSGRPVIQESSNLIWEYIMKLNY